MSDTTEAGDVTRARPQPAEVYDKADLIAAAPAGFGVYPEVMAGALRLAGLVQASREQAEAAVRAFLAREV